VVRLTRLGRFIPPSPTVASPHIFERGAGPKPSPTDLVHYLLKMAHFPLQKWVPVKKVSKSKIIGGLPPPPHTHTFPDWEGRALPGLDGSDATG